MSLKDQTGRKITSPLSIKVPRQYSNDFESVTFFEEIKLRMYELFAIVDAGSEVKDIDGDYTTDGSEILLAKDNVTITLSLTPVDQEKVQIKNTGGIVRIDGNGRNIDGDDILIVDKVWDAPTIIYIEAQDQWYLF